MFRLRRFPFFFAMSFALVMFLLGAGCSGDDDHPAVPDDPGIPNTPSLPTPETPLSELPTRSEFLVVESAELRNFSPPLTSLSDDALSRLNEAYVLEFQLPPGYTSIVEDGRALYPEGLQCRRTGGSWVGFTRMTSRTLFTELGSHEGSYYYLSRFFDQWAYADVNCRNYGGLLACPETAAENTFILNAVQAARPDLDYYLIGLTDWSRNNNDWIWLSGEPVTWTNWRPGQPDNSGGEYFAQVYPDGKWNDTRYDFRYPYVLERSTPLLVGDETEYSCAAIGDNVMYLGALATPTVMPHVQRHVYWQRVFQVTLGPGATYSEEHSYAHGTAETVGMAFGWSIGVAAEASWGPATVQIESEFHQDFNREVTVHSEETFTKTYEYTAPQDRTVVLALWQLRERFVITDSAGEPWADPLVVIDGTIPFLDQGLQQEYLQATRFDAR